MKSFIKATAVALLLLLIVCAGFYFAFHTAGEYARSGREKKKKGDLEGALADYDRAVLLDPIKASFRNNRGLIKAAKGDFDGALADYKSAIELDPRNVAAYDNRGNLYAHKGDFLFAEQNFTHALEIDPNHAPTYKARGHLKMIQQDWSGALLDLRHAGELSADGEDYTKLYIWLSQVSLGETEAANEELTDWFKNHHITADGGWSTKVAGHLLDTVPEADLLAAASSPDKIKERGQMCEYWYFTGMKKLFAGDKKTAAENFRKSLATGETNFVEYGLAKNELKALGE